VTGVGLADCDAFFSARLVRFSSALRRLSFSRWRLATVFRCLAISHPPLGLAATLNGPLRSIGAQELRGHRLASWSTVRSSVLPTLQDSKGLFE